MKVGWVVQLMKDPSKIFPEFSFLFFDFVAKGNGKDWAQYRTLIITNGKNSFLAKKKKGGGIVVEKAWDQGIRSSILHILKSGMS